MTFYIEANDYEEAFEKAKEEYREEALKQFIKWLDDEVTFKYGAEKPYTYSNGEKEDTEWIEYGEFDMSIDDFEFDIDEVIEFSRELLEEYDD